MIATRFCTPYLFVCLLWAGAALAQAADFASALPLAGGKVVGVVSVVGALEKPKPLPVFKSRSFCGASVPNETLLVSADGRLRNAAVILRSLNVAVIAGATDQNRSRQPTLRLYTPCSGRAVGQRAAAQE